MFSNFPKLAEQILTQLPQIELESAQQTAILGDLKTQCSLMSLGRTLLIWENLGFGYLAYHHYHESIQKVQKQELLTFAQTHFTQLHEWTCIELT